jgi:FkbM family methyltransferase
VGREGRAKQRATYTDHARVRRELARLRSAARRIRQTFGFEVRRHQSVLGYDLAPFRHRARLLACEDVHLVIDVGANVGQYASALRRGGYPGDILSLEPLAEPFAALRARAAGDPHWTCEQVALGERSGFADLRVAAHSAGSSFLEVGETLVANTPEMATVGSERVRVEPLAHLLESIASNSAFLKLDVQGFELQILRAGEDILPRLAGIEVELSFEPLYEGEGSFLEVTQLLDALGFRLAAVDPGIPDRRTGFPLQVDGIYLPGAAR